MCTLWASMVLPGVLMMRMWKEDARLCSCRTPCFGQCLLLRSINKHIQMQFMTISSTTTKKNTCTKADWTIEDYILSATHPVCSNYSVSYLVIWACCICPSSVGEWVRHCAGRWVWWPSGSGRAVWVGWWVWLEFEAGWGAAMLRGLSWTAWHWKPGWAERHKAENKRGLDWCVNHCLDARCC